MFVAIITHPSGNGLSNMSKDDVAIYGPFDSRNEAYIWIEKTVTVDSGLVASVQLVRSAHLPASHR